MPELPSYDRLPMDWVGDWAGCRARLTPAREALVDATTGERWTFARLDERANRVANWLTETCGLAARERVAFIARNRIEAIDLYLACGKAGLVLAPLSHRLSANELSTLVARIQPRVIFVEECFAALVEAMDWTAAGASVVWLTDGGGGQYESNVLAASAKPANRALALADPFLYIHTGGSTGPPKICIVSHRQMVWNSIELVIAAPEGLAHRRELLFFPLFHIGGWNTFTPVLHAGGRTVLLRAFEPAAALATLEREKINHFGAVESILNQLSQNETFAATDLSALEAITTAAAPCSTSAMEPFRARGIAVTQSYGQTEAGPSNFMRQRLGRDADELRDHDHSIGSAFFHCDYRIVDPGTEAPVAAGTCGELWLRSPHGFDGYLDDAERTERTMTADGWIRTGDLAREERGGYVVLAGRLDNVFVSGGENISPEELEATLCDYPGIAQAVVFGVPDKRWGEVGMAIIVPRGARPEVAELEAWLAPRLAGYKRPRHYVFVDGLPLTGAGKIDRQAARNRFAQTLQESTR